MCGGKVPHNQLPQDIQKITRQDFGGRKRRVQPLHQLQHVQFQQYSNIHPLISNYKNSNYKSSSYSAPSISKPFLVIWRLSILTSPILVAVLQPAVFMTENWWAWGVGASNPLLSVPKNKNQRLGDQLSHFTIIQSELFRRFWGLHSSSSKINSIANWLNHLNRAWLSLTKKKQLDWRS